MPVAKKPKTGRAISASSTTSKPTAVSAASAGSMGSKAAAAAEENRAGIEDRVEDCLTAGRQPVKCAVCEQYVVDGKDQALFCEGQCQCWSHRYCAGVSCPF